MLSPISTDSLRRLWRSGQPHCTVQKANNQSINNITDTLITWDSESSTDFDEWGMHSTSSNTERIVIPLAGRYLAVCNILWESSTTAGRRLRLIRNNSSAAAINHFAEMALKGGSGDTLDFHFVAGVEEFAAGEIITAQCRQASGGALNIVAGNRTTYISVTRIG